MVMGKTCRLEKEQETNLKTKQSFVLQQHAKQSAGCMGFNTLVSDSAYRINKSIQTFIYISLRNENSQLGKSFWEGYFKVNFYTSDVLCADEDEELLMGEKTNSRTEIK